MMKVLCESVKGVIKDGKLICGEIFNMCWIFDKQQMWNSIFQKFSELLNLEKNDIHKDNYQWAWIVQHLVENKQLLCWLDKSDQTQSNVKFEEIKWFCDKQVEIEMKKNMNEMKEEMEKK